MDQPAAGGCRSISAASQSSDSVNASVGDNPTIEVQSA